MKVILNLLFVFMLCSGCTSSMARKHPAAFEYRAIYTPNNANTAYLPAGGVNNVDDDWGIWGHNLAKILTDSAPEECYAQINGKRDPRQYCLSSPELYKLVEAYILENYGEGVQGKSERFALLPNDNDLVCQCEQCVLLGNSVQNASPANAALVERLAKRFPAFRFFMSAYRTTIQPPQHPLPSNAGVIVSAIDLPLTPELLLTTPSVQTFTHRLQQWKACVPLVYVWDYIRNFDDYLTPYPCLNRMKNRLLYYRTNGVKGLFLNGSGYDYASFDDLQTFVLAALMDQPEQEVDELIDHYCSIAYPTSAQGIATYYHSLEQAAMHSTKPLSFYGGIEEAEKSYLDADTFFRFYSQLPVWIERAQGEERENLSKLYTALSFTRLELERKNKRLGEDLPETASWLEQFSTYAHYREMKHYRESQGALSTYVEEWNQRLASPAPPSYLKDQKLTLLDATDREERTTALLTDGRYGFASDYHTGWLVSDSPEWGVELSVPNLPHADSLHLSFLHAPCWKIYAPIEVKVYVHEELAVSVPVLSVKDEKFPFQRVEAVVRLNRSLSGLTVKILFVRASETNAQTACDEIWFN